jgi:predicted nucleic acid-binding protein
MIVVADASVLVAELLRKRGRALFRRPDLEVVTPEDQWDETEHELQRRLRLMLDQGRMTAKQVQELSEDVQAVIDEQAMTSHRAPGMRIWSRSHDGAFRRIRTTGHRWHSPWFSRLAS